MKQKDIKLYGAFILSVGLVAIIVGLSVYYGVSRNDCPAAVKNKPTPVPTTPPTPSRDPNAAEVYSKAAVAADSPICSKVGKDILMQKGSAVDALIATLVSMSLYYHYH